MVDRIECGELEGKKNGDLEQGNSRWGRRKEHDDRAKGVEKWMSSLSN